MFDLLDLAPDVRGPCCDRRMPNLRVDLGGGWFMLARVTQVAVPMTTGMSGAARMVKTTKDALTFSVHPPKGVGTLIDAAAAQVLLTMLTHPNAVVVGAAPAPLPEDVAEEVTATS
ncbi:MAG: hypothetical protein KIT31_13895 [Deltaproteobacteria bacterium]|nr:hypothetical protein [Deltaproteobacteria bacterium]